MNIREIRKLKQIIKEEIIQALLDTQAGKNIVQQAALDPNPDNQLGLLKHLIKTTIEDEVRPKTPKLEPVLQPIVMNSVDKVLDKELTTSDAILGQKIGQAQQAAIKSKTQPPVQPKEQTPFALGTQKAVPRVRSGNDPEARIKTVPDIKKV